MTGADTKDRLAKVKNMKNVTIHRAGTTSKTLDMLNSKSPKLKDKRVRKAIFETINRKTLDKIDFQGLDYSETPPGSFILYPFQKGYKNSLKEAGYKQSDHDANKLLDEAGWKKGSDGIRAKGGKKLSLRAPLIGNDPTDQAMAKAKQSMLKKIGVKYKIEQKPSSDFSKEFTSQDWDMFNLGFTDSDPFGVAFMCQLYCSTNNQLNRSFTGSKKWDKKIHALGKIGNKQEQTAAAAKLEPKIMKNTWGVFPERNGPTIYVTKKGAANLGPAQYSVSGPDLFGVHAVEDAGWQKGKSPS
jgi:peptide/nickel transport system substrate-binding protein